MTACAGDRTAPIRQLESADASERILAIVKLAKLNEQNPDSNDPEAPGSIVPLLVDRLEDEDEGVRFFAIVALHKLTGTRLGYHYGDPDHVRRQAVQRWRRFTFGNAETLKRRKVEKSKSQNTEFSRDP